MKRYTAIFLSLALLTVGFAATASASDEDRIEQQLDLRERYDGQFDDAETTSYEFNVPADSLYAFTVDWETGETSVDVLEQPLSAHEDNAGCASTSHDSTPWAQPTVAVDDCEYTTVENSISNTTLICATDGDGCSTDGLNFDFFDFGFFFVSCEQGVSAELVDWSAGTGTIGATCEVTQDGQSPLGWDEYDGVCGSAFEASAGLASCIHQP